GLAPVRGSARGRAAPGRRTEGRGPMTALSVAAKPVEPQEPRRMPRRRLRRSGSRWDEVRSSLAFWVGGAVVLLVLLSGLLAPWIAPHDPLALNLENPFGSPSADHLL